MKILIKIAKILKIKALLLCAALIFSCINIFGQSITWQRTYDGRDGVADGGYSVCKADGDNFYICGYTTFLPNIRRIYILKINPYGDTIWTKSITIGSDSLEGECLTAVSTSDNGCILTGASTNAFSIKINFNGEIIWNKTYDLYAKQLYEIIKTSDGGYIACGRDYEDINDNAFLLKIDSIGNLLWHKTFYSTYWKNFDCITETNNYNGYFVGGFNINFQSDTTKSFILKVNQNGDSLWQKQFERNVSWRIRRIARIPNGYLIGNNSFINNIGQNSIMRLDENANITFQKTIESDNTFKILTDIKIINSNKYVISSSKQYSNGLLLTVDSTGNVINEKVYTSPDFLTIRSILPISNGDILFAGAVDFDSILTKRDIYALRTDSLLNAPPPIGINNIKNSIPKYFVLFQNYPNPFNPVTKIKFQIPSVGTDLRAVSINVYDISGRLVKTILQQNIKPGSYEVSFDGSNLSSGIYIYQLNSGIFSDSKKMVLIK